MAKNAETVSKYFKYSRYQVPITMRILLLDPESVPFPPLCCVCVKSYKLNDYKSISIEKHLNTEPFPRDSREIQGISLTLLQDLSPKCRRGRQTGNTACFTVSPIFIY